MTENELRNKVAQTISAWIGGVRGGKEHLDILATYNTYRPLARGYTVKQSDAYCAATVSAAFIRAGIAEYTGTECSCNQFIEIARKKGYWVEDDAYVPKIGDACVYDWQDSGVGDNVGSADHIGIVTDVNGSTFVVTEGNMSGGKIGTRSMAVNGKYIRGFIAPDYAAIAQKLTPEVAELTDGDILALWNRILDVTSRQPLPDWAVEEYAEARSAGITDGTSPMQPLTRCQGALMALRAHGVEGGS